MARIERLRSRSFSAACSFLNNKIGGNALIRERVSAAAYDALRFAVKSGPNIALPVIGIGSVVLFTLAQCAREYDRDTAMIDALSRIGEEKLSALYHAIVATTDNERP